MSSGIAIGKTLRSRTRLTTRIQAEARGSEKISAADANAVGSINAQKYAYYITAENTGRRLMICSFDDFRCKEVINIKTGAKIGYPDDIEFETHTAKICKMIIFGKAKFFGLFGRAPDIVIPWSEIEVIGDDTILINNCAK